MIVDGAFSPDAIVVSGSSGLLQMEDHSYCD